jgi:hypothetical protein
VFGLTDEEPLLADILPAAKMQIVTSARLSGSSINDASADASTFYGVIVDHLEPMPTRILILKTPHDLFIIALSILNRTTIIITSISAAITSISL